MTAALLVLLDKLDPTAKSEGAVGLGVLVMLQAELPEEALWVERPFAHRDGSFGLCGRRDGQTGVQPKEPPQAAQLEA
jgi:hypothetical protein